MTCSDFRESISAHVDGESAGVDLAALHRHLAGCVACRRFEGDALQLRAASRGWHGTAPDLSEQILGRGEQGRSGRARRDRGVLRVGLVLVALGELVSSTLLFVSQRGYGGEDHAGHESLSFSIAVCVGLCYIAWRPRAASAHLPILGVAVGLLGLTAVIDVRTGRAGLLEELPHFNLLVGFVVVWFLARHERPHGGQPSRLVISSPAGSPSARGISVVTRTVAACARLVTPRRLGVALAAGLLVLVVGAPPASAHAVLEGSTPAPDSLLGSAPSRVTLSYDEAVTILPTSLRVYGPDGSRVDDARVLHPQGVGERVSVGMEPTTARGTYLVSWRVISADSHPVSGAFTFAVGARSATPTAHADHTNRAVAVALGTCRIVGYLGCALLVGGLAFLALAWPAGGGSRRSRALLLVGALGLVASSAAAILLKGPYDAALGLGSISEADLMKETLSTIYGRAMLVRFTLAFLAAALLLDARRLGRAQGLALGVLAVGVVASFPFTGHAVAGDQRLLALGSDLVHVSAMSVWLGGLMMLVVPLMRSPPAEVAPAVQRFSTVALVCVALLVATGSYQAWRQVRAWGALTHTTYGQELLIKVGLVALVLVVAWFSRAWVTRSARAPEPPQTVRRLRLSVTTEAAIAAVVLGVTSALVATEPASTAYHPTVAATLSLGPDTVHVSAVPVGDRSMDLDLHVFDKSQQPTGPREVTADVILKSHGIGPLPLRLEKVDVGHMVGHLAVPVSGDWILTVRVRTTAFDEYAKTLALPVR